MNPGSNFEIGGDPAAMSLFGFAAPMKMESRSFSVQNLGIFATTGLTDKSRFLVDFSYGDLGNLTKSLRIQYGYFEFAPRESLIFRAGKITLPLGIYNDHHFYPFQRSSVTGPTFLSGILGLPISDMGASVAKNFDAGPAKFGVDLYAVNGYGPVPTRKYEFRNASLPGGLSILNNISSNDANHKVATGGRFRLYMEGKAEFDGGFSVYQDQWDVAGTNFFGMNVAHLNLGAGPLKFRSEYLWMTVGGDMGFAGNVGSSCWKTTGFHTGLRWEDLQVGGKNVTPWIRYEEYLSEGSLAGHGLEWLLEGAGGFQVELSESINLKFEASRLKYEIPFEGKGTLSIKGWSGLAGLSVTY